MPYSDKSKQAAYQRRYYQSNKDKNKQRDAVYYLKNRQRKLTKQKERYETIKQNKPPKGKYAEAHALGYRSMFEVSIVRAVEAAGLTVEYEPFFIPYIIKGSYRPDFILPNGIIVEAKGYLDTAACKKMLAVKSSNPHLDIRFVFQDINGKRNKRSKMRYWEWCEKHRFQYAEKTIPLEWWKEKPIDQENTDN